MISTIDKDWYKRPLRISAMQCESETNSIQVLETWADMGFNTEQLLHISAEGYRGYFREDRSEEISEYLERAKEIGLRIIFYLGFVGPKEIRENREWLNRDKQGNVVGIPCINNGPYRAWYMEQVSNVAALSIDGLFLDGPYFPPDTCYCSYCSDGYLKKHGANLPVNVDPGNKEWRDFIEFRYDSIAGFLRDVRYSLKSVNPDAILYMNGQPLSSGVVTGRDNRRLMPYQDILGAEGGFIFYTKSGDVPWWKTGVTARLIESQSNGKPRVIFIAADHKRWSRYLHTASENRLMIADAVANGANPWYGIHSSIEDLKSPGGQAAAKMMRFLRDNEETYSESESLADTAVLWSLKTADYYAQESEVSDFVSEAHSSKHTVSYSSCFGGFCEMLLRLHVQFDVIDEQTIMEPRLSRYRTLILPDCAVLGDEEVAALRKFVSSGGNIICSFETAVYDQNYVKREVRGLDDILGINVSGNLYDFRDSSYIELADSSQFRDGVYPVLLPAPSCGLEVHPTSAEPIAVFREPMYGQYTPMSPLATTAILANSYNRGKAVYLAGNFGEHFKDYGICDHLKLLGNIMKWLSPPLILTYDLPETVEVVIRAPKEQKKLIVHLVNFTGEMKRPINKVINIDGASIEIPKALLSAIDIEVPQQVRALVADINLEWQYQEDKILIVLPRLAEYEVVVISWES